MKTKNNKALIATVVVSAIALFALTKMAANVVPAATIATGYAVVLTLVALTVADYRSGAKDYSAR